jgi:polyisoprenyl-phosphate glycosyltransferase
MPEHSVAVVIPVYRGTTALETVVDELLALSVQQRSSDGHSFRVAEIVLVHDRGPGASDLVIRRLAEQHDGVRPVWLSRNYGQHAATLAGMASTSADWVVTMDEDGQHDPAALSSMLDRAMATQSPLVYARPTNVPPHGPLRNITSRLAHRIARTLSGRDLSHFHSFRLVLGEHARGLAAYCGESVYLDIALTWVVDRSVTCPVTLRPERDGTSGYSTRRLISHFWRLILTSGTKPLRWVAMYGALLSLIAVVVLAYVLWQRFVSDVQSSVPGWTSVMVVILVTSGGILFSLGIVAEYLGIAVKTAMGKPLYLVVTDLASGPLGRTPMVQQEESPADTISVAHCPADDDPPSTDSGP